MKYTIEELSQEYLLELGMDCIDAVILSFVIKFYMSSKMKVRIIDGEPYVWILYQAILNEVPIIGIEKRQLRRRFQKYVDCGLMKHQTIREGGVYSYYRINPEMLTRLMSGSSTRWYKSG